MTSQPTSTPAPPEASSFADLAADGRAVRRALRALERPLPTVPEQRVISIPGPALAAVAGLGVYGD